MFAIEIIKIKNKTYRLLQDVVSGENDGTIAALRIHHDAVHVRQFSGVDTSRPKPSILQYKMILQLWIHCTMYIAKNDMELWWLISDGFPSPITVHMISLLLFTFVLVYKPIN